MMSKSQRLINARRRDYGIQEEFSAHFEIYIPATFHMGCAPKTIEKKIANAKQHIAECKNRFQRDIENYENGIVRVRLDV